MDFSNTIELFGVTVKPIHFQAATFVVILVFGVIGSFFYKTLKTRWEGRGNRQLDHYLDTVTEASEIDADGYRTLSISNKGMTERVETVIRGNNERNWLIVAAKNCDWTRRFVKDTDAKCQARILHVVRNAMTRHFADGENAHDAGLPTVSTDYFYSPTGADAEVGGVRMIRNMWAIEPTLHIFDTHPVDKWKFEIDKVTGEMQDHKVRVTTMREMAEALFRNNGCCDLNGKKVRIIGWMRGRVRV